MDLPRFWDLSLAIRPADQHPMVESGQQLIDGTTSSWFGRKVRVLGRHKPDRMRGIAIDVTERPPPGRSGQTNHRTERQTAQRGARCD